MQVKDWIQLVLLIITFLSILVAAAKVITMAQFAIKLQDTRITNLENLNIENTQMKEELATINGKVDVMTQEIERMRNRLDRFLDTTTPVRLDRFLDTTASVR